MNSFIILKIMLVVMSVIVVGVIIFFVVIHIMGIKNKRDKDDDSIYLNAINTKDDSFDSAIDDIEFCIKEIKKQNEQLYAVTQLMKKKGDV